MSSILRISPNAAVHLIKSPAILQRSSYSTLLLTEKRKNQYIRSTPSVAPVRYNSTQILANNAGFYGEIASSNCVCWCQDFLINTHDYTGLPWWATIVLTTVGLRTFITFPLTVYTQKLIVRLEEINARLPAIASQLRAEIQHAKEQHKFSDLDGDRLYLINIREHYNRMVVEENCHPGKSFVVLWTQVPLWICQSISIRNLVTMMPDPTSLQAQITYTMLSVGGFAWMSSLTTPDPTFILPALLCVINLANIELTLLSKSTPPMRLQTIVMTLCRVFIIIWAPVAACMPSCLALYWTTSSAYTLAQNLIIISPKVKRLLRIPLTSRDHMEQPYRTIAARFSEKMQQRRDFVWKLLRLKN